ncbi:MAG: sugar-binding transcriptional regulator, partial [Pseudomonadota bacterium]|nr:sugar-binding transcriptional regulator [Pseudomonadota bacterium]
MGASGEVDLERYLADTYGLDHCEVVTDMHQDDLPLGPLGQAGGKFLAHEIGRQEPMLIGVSYGRTLLACIDNLGRRPAPHIRVVSLMGELTRSFDANPHVIVHRLAELTGAEATVMPAPFMANNAKDRDVLLSQKEIARAYQLARDCDLLLAGIGTTLDEAVLVTTGMIEPAEMQAIARAGGSGELLGHFFDDQGRPVENEVTGRILTLPLEQLKNRKIVAVAGGRMKVRAVKAVLESGLL